MYFPVGWPKQLETLQDESDLIHISCNEERQYFCILSQKALSVWFARPAVQIVSFRRSENSVSKFGENVQAQWKPDSSMLAVITDKGYVIFFKIQVDVVDEQSVLYTQKEGGRNDNRSNLSDGHDRESVPALKLIQSEYIQVQGGVTSLVCLRDELMVATGEGLLQRIRWDGLTNAELTISVASIPFSVDLQHSRASLLTDSGTYVRDFQYSPLLGGFAAVLSNGRAAFITANTLKFEPDQVVGVWAQEVSEATCVAVNDRYTLMAFGCKSGKGIVYHLDELSGALVISHELIVSSKDFPDACSMCGPVRQLKWTPDGSALALAWTNGGFSLWSVYGALLLHSMGIQGGSFSEDISRNPMLKLKSVEWGSEGYHLWLVSEHRHHPVDMVLEEVVDEPPPRPHLLMLHFAKSALTVNPCVSNHEHVFLQGEDKLYLCTEETIPSWTQESNRQTESSSTAFTGNKQWQIVPIPHSYIAHNWPIRYATVSSSGHCVAVAGKTGLAHYALFSRKWKLFGNITQERDMVVNGGLAWWRDFVCAACHIEGGGGTDELRFYPRDAKLDNTFAASARLPCPAVLINVFRDILILLGADCHVLIFRMERHSGQQYPSLCLSKLQEVAVGNFITHPSTVLAITMTSIRTDAANVKNQPQPYEAESIIVNVAGRLLMFQRDRSGLILKPQDSPSKDRPLPFLHPVMVASNVEAMWYCVQKNEKKPHLTEALWLCCGAAGVKVWLPLQPRDDESLARSRSFMSKRIMLPFHVNIYPLAVLFEAGILLGASSDSLSYRSVKAVEEGWPYLQLERTNQVYLHQILRMLLRRNLGVAALEIAKSCCELPYFGHVLELLVHEVLEEEATSKEPIPDPLLPRVVAFVEEFPEYLQTVVHCARKTEVALWPYLFSTVGNPKDLFEKCLISGNLMTAASYLIILQNLEKPMVARQHATLLLDAALEACHWDMARDLLRFLKAIDPNEAESPHESTKTRLTSSTVYPAVYPSPPPLSPSVDGSGGGAFVYPSTGQQTARVRSMSVSKDDSDGPAVAAGGGKTRHKTMDAGTKKPLVKEDSVGADQFYIDIILNRHARKLLSSYRLRDLAFFAANLDDYQLVSWLRKERLRAARVEDFVAACKKLHEDFTWPLPIVSLSSLREALPAGRPPTTLLDIQVNGDHKKEDTFSNVVLRRSASYGSSSAAYTEDVHLQPQISVSTTSLTTVSEDEGAGSSQQTAGSDTGSAGGGESGAGDWPLDAITVSHLEHWSMELANKGPPETEHQLRYLYQMVLEAGCLEWALLVSIVLRDAMAVVRTVNTASMLDTPIEVIGRMREGLSFMQRWADTECLGYRSFLSAIQGQSRQLDSIVEQELTTSRLSPAIRAASVDPPAVDREHDDDDDEQIWPQNRQGDVNDNGQEANQGYECSVS